MKIRKLLAAAFGCFALLFGTTAAHAAETAVADVGGRSYNTLEAAFDALGGTQTRLTLRDEGAWDADRPVYWKAGTAFGYEATLVEGLTAAFKANAGAITIVCRPDSDVGEMTHGHVADDITIYGNKAFVSGGECDLEVDTCKYSRETGAQDSSAGFLTKDISVTAYGLDNLGVWGERHTGHTVSISLNDCDGKAVDGVSANVQRVYISGTLGKNVIVLKGCDFITERCAVYSNADGSLKVENCSFANVREPININHKSSGAMTVDVKGTTFTSCGSTESDDAQYAAPIRFLNSGDGTLDANVAESTFSGTVGANGDILLGDGRTDKVSNAVGLKVSDTAANVQLQQPGYYATNGTTDDSKRVTATISSSDTLETDGAQTGEIFKTVAMIGEAKYSSLAAAIEAALALNDGTPVEIQRDITFAPGDTWTPIAYDKGSARRLVVNGNGYKIVNLPNSMFAHTERGYYLRMSNLTFENPVVKSDSDAAVIVGWAESVDELTFTDVAIRGAKVTGGNYAAGFVGYCALDNSGKKAVTYTRCEVSGSTITGGSSAGAVMGHANGAVNGSVHVVDVVVKNNVIICTEAGKTQPGTTKAGAVFGTVGASDTFVSAAVSDNTVISGGVSIEAGGVAVSTIYGRLGTEGGTLSLTGGTYDHAPIADADAAWATVAKGYKPTVNDDGTWSVTMHVVAKVGTREFNSLADALKAAIAANDGVAVEIVDDITFEDGDTWTPVKIGENTTLVVNGNGKTITGLPGCLLGTTHESEMQTDSSLTMKNLKFVNPKVRVNKPKIYGDTRDYSFAAVILAEAYGMDATLEKVEIEGADVRGGDDCYTAGFVGWCNDKSSDPDAKHPVVKLQNCALRNSTIIGCGTAAGLVGHVAANETESVILTVTDCEVVNNTIVCTEAGRTDKAGAVVATVAAEGATVSAKMSGNKVYSGKGSLDDTDDTTWKTGTEITTVYGRRGGSGTLSLTGGTYDHAPIADADAAWATVAKGYDMAENDGTWSVTMHVVAKVGDKEFNSLADALKAAIAAKNATVEIVDDITFEDGDTWEPVVFSRGKTLVVNGNGKTITGLPEQLLNNGLDVEPYGNVLRISNLTFLNPKASTVAVQNSAGEWFGSVGVILGYTYGLEEVTLDGVVIDGADVRGHGDCFAAGFLAWCNGFEGVMSITIKNCALRNSTIVGGGSAGGLIAFTSNDGNLVDLTVENTVVENNTIVCTEAGRTDKAGAVIATIGASGAEISATTRGNKVYSGGGAVADTDDTNWKTGTEITTVYGRHVGPGTLTITGGTYDARPFNAGDDWAKLAEWSKFDEQDGVFKVVDNLATLGNVKARQRYPWNGLVDITFELKSKNAARVFIVAEYVDGGETKRLPMAAAKLVNDDKSESDVNVSTGFTVPAQATAKTIHVIWDSTVAVPTRLSGVTFKVYAK